MSSLYQGGHAADGAARAGEEGADQVAQGACVRACVRACVCVCVCVREREKAKERKEEMRESKRQRETENPHPIHSTDCIVCTNWYRIHTDSEYTLAMNVLK